MIVSPPEGAFVFGGHATLALAAVRLGRREFEGAEELAAPLLEAAHRGGWVETEAQAAIVIARCHEARGDAALAEAFRERALRLASAVGLPAVERAAGGVGGGGALHPDTTGIRSRTR